MVRHYKRCTERCTYSHKTLTLAINAIKNGMSKKKASYVFSVPRTTLIKQIKRMDDGNIIHPPRLGRFRRVFSDDFECELVMHVVEMQSRFYGIGLLELRRIAFELAEQNGIVHPLSRVTKLAGTDWAASFLRRYPELSLRHPEPTSMSRLSGFNRVQVNRLHTSESRTRDQTIPGTAYLQCR